MEPQQAKNSFRSSYINSVAGLFHSAEKMVKDSELRMAANKENYKGQLLDEKNREEKQLRQRNLELACSQIEGLRDKEIKLITKSKEIELKHPPKETLDNLEALKDIITEDELQLYADRCRQSPIVQRRIISIARERNMDIYRYPDFNEKINAVMEAASAFISYIKYENFGMEPAVYEKITLPEYDDILEPKVKGAAE